MTSLSKKQKKIHIPHTIYEDDILNTDSDDYSENPLMYVNNPEKVIVQLISGKYMSPKFDQYIQFINTNKLIPEYKEAVEYRRNVLRTVIIRYYNKNDIKYQNR